MKNCARPPPTWSKAKRLATPTFVAVPDDRCCRCDAHSLEKRWNRHHDAMDITEGIVRSAELTPDWETGWYRWD